MFLFVSDLGVDFWVAVASLVKDYYSKVKSHLQVKIFIYLGRAG